MHKVKKVMTRVLNPVICFTMVFAVLLTTLAPAFADKNNSTDALAGSNLALGSPLLESSFVADDWNKWETILWGVFISNFVVPFYDDYESAFTNNSSGSKGGGLKALCFGTGSTAANSELIQNMLTQAIDFQKNRYEAILVDYSLYSNFEIVRQGELRRVATGSGGDTPETGTSGITSIPYTSPRNAKVKDLIFNNSKNAMLSSGSLDVISDVTWSIFSNGIDPASTSHFSWIKEASPIVKMSNYRNMVGVSQANLPTFAVKGLDGTWEIVLDYCDSYDIEVMVASIVKALSGEFKDGVADNIENMMNSDLVFDGFGNICARYNGKNIILLQASANQYLTSTPSLNLVNSVIFNASTPAADSSNLNTVAGQSQYKSTGWLGWVAKWFTNNNLEKYYSGGAAFTNAVPGMDEGGVALFYDTDTIITQMIQDGKIQMSGDRYVIRDLSYLQELYNIDINDGNNKYPFKIEPVNLSDDFLKGIDDTIVLDSSVGSDGLLKDSLMSTIMGAGSIVNATESSTVKRRTVELKTYGNARDEEPLFSTATVLPVQLPEGKNSGKLNSAAAVRALSNFMFKVYDQGNIAAGGYTATRSEVEAILSTDTTPSGTSSIATGTVGNYKALYKLINGTTSSSSSPSNFIKAFYSAHNGSLFSVNSASLPDATISTSSPYDAVYGNLSGSGVASLTTSDNENSGNIDSIDGLSSEVFGRTVKVYHTSEVLSKVADVLGMREGSDFAAFASYIYLTYIDWYQLKKDPLSDEYVSDFNKNIFPEEVLTETVTDYSDDIPSAEEQKKQIINYTYLMLNPDAGRDYRNSIMLTGMADFLYEQYQRIVYGGASSYNQGLVTTRNSTGFLAINPYEENMFTAWFMDNYVTVSVYVIVFGLLAVILVGALNRKKLSWFVFSFIAIINVVLVIPSIGSAVPNIANSMVQGLFDDKMTYWSISEQMSAAIIEQEAIESKDQNYGGLSNEDWAQVYSLSNNIKSLYLDRYISVKQDISNKVTSTAGSNWEEVQKLQSARWLLPMIMREFSSNESTDKYVYVTLSDKYENISNMYWFYKPTASVFAKTVNGASSTATEYNPTSTGDIRELSGRQSVWAGVTESYIADPADDRLKYRSYAYTNAVNYGEPYLAHTYSYMLQDSIISDWNFTHVDYEDGMRFNEWGNKFDEYLQSTSLSTTAESVYQTLTDDASDYNAYDRSSVKQSYGYLWTTESSLPYFYQVAAETFKDDTTVGFIASSLQGKYVDGFHQSYLTDDFGNSRDILDLENLFNNLIPYIYTTQIYTGGFDGTSGEFGTDKIGDDLVSHQNQQKSWMFRSNWVSKLMENREFNGSCNIHWYDAYSGERMTASVPCMLMPHLYEEVTGGARGMVFSRAQMEALGLTEYDLSEVELKCVTLNDQIYEKWTLLLNYVATPGMKHQILIRQMGVDAWTTFNTVFSPNGLSLINNSQLYPTSLDLRAISFDSVMTMLMLSVTEDTSYIYGDSMSVVIENTDMFTAVLLWIVAIVCVVLVPFVRDLTLAAIFYIGYVIVAKAILGSSDTKKKTSLGYLACNVVYIMITGLYFLSFKVLMAAIKSDDVLRLQEMTVKTGSPVGCLIVVLIINVLYFIGIGWLCVTCVKNYRDMGYTVFKGVVDNISTTFSAGFESLASKISGESSGKSGSGKSQDGADTMSGSGSGSGGTGGSGDSGDSKPKKDKGPREIKNEDDLNSAASGINSASGDNNSRTNDAAMERAGTEEIDAAIKEGRETRATVDVSSIKTAKQAQTILEENQRKLAMTKLDYNDAMERANQWRASAERDGVDSEFYQSKLKNYQLEVDKAQKAEFAGREYQDNITVVERRITEIEAKKSSKSSKKTKTENSENTMSPKE